jgi:hypothetical protein
MGEFHNRPWTEGWGYKSDRLHANSLYQADNVAGMVGQAFGLAGQSPTGITAASSVGAFEATATIREIAQKLRINLTIAALANNPTTVLGAATAAQYASTLDEYEPFETVRSQLAEENIKKTMRSLLDIDLKAVEQEVEFQTLLPAQLGEAILNLPGVALAVAGTVQARPSLREADIARAIKQHHLETGKTSLRDQYRNRLTDDPALKPLKEAYRKRMFAQPDADEDEQFAGQFFSAHKPFEPRSFFGDPDREYKWWTTVDQPSERVPFEPARNPLAAGAGTVGAALGGDPYSVMAVYLTGTKEPEIRREVEKAWRYQKARELAKKEAERLQKEAAETKGDLRKLEDLGAKLKKSVIKLEPMARQKRGKTTNPLAGARYEGPKIDKSKVPGVGREEGRQMAAELLRLREKPKGETLVVADPPESAYYIAVLLGESDPSMTDFLQAYQYTAAGATEHDPLFDDFLREQQRKYRLDLMDRLRADAKLEILNKETFNRLGGASTLEE